MMTGRFLADWKSVHETSFELLEQANARRREFTDQPRYFDARTAEFLLLYHRLQRLESFGPVRVLEVGCGSAYSLRLWAPWVDEAVGVDLPPAIRDATRLLAAFPPPRGNIQLVEDSAETLERLRGPFDLILTQYVLEHVPDPLPVLQRLGELASPQGLVIHALPNLLDRLAWYQEYRSRRPLPGRVLDSVRARGAVATLLAPLVHTPPHEPALGGFEREYNEYRMENWALQILRAGFEIVDCFQLRDAACIYVTRPLEEAA